MSYDRNIFIDYSREYVMFSVLTLRKESAMKNRAELEKLQRAIGTIAAMLSVSTIEEKKIIAEIALADTREGHGAIFA